MNHQRLEAAALGWTRVPEAPGNDPRTSTVATRLSYLQTARFPGLKSWAILTRSLRDRRRWAEQAKPSGQAGVAVRGRWMLLIALLALLGAGGSDEKADPTNKKVYREPAKRPALTGFLKPRHQVVLESQTVQIIAALPKVEEKAALIVDGKPIKTRVFCVSEGGKATSGRGGGTSGQARSALEALTTLAPGKHVIEAGGFKAEVLVKTDKDAKGPEGWGVFRSHPSPVVNCGVCHTVKASGGASLLGPAREPEACLVCHNLDEFKLVHSHRLESLAACRMCHAVHGGTTKALLVDTPKRLCAACHD
ncbi:MAG: hypothetical protein JXQ73_07195 [Phycisphaerae bacterium]|nr:hypothetical protein [Phycisphaerae bacterium]